MLLSEIISQELTFRDENRDAHSGQSDMTLYAFRGGQYVGKIDYVLFQGGVHVGIIEVKPSERRKGYGTALIKKLQSMYPDTEIDLGGLTDDGAKLIPTIPQRVVDNPDYKAKTERLQQLRQQEAEFEKLSAKFEADPTEENRQRVVALRDAWNDLNDEVWELERDLRDMKPSTRFFET